MKVSIIIPTYNRFDLLKPCLDSVEKYTDLKDKEIVIVSNGCKDKTVRFIKLKQDIGLPYKLLEFPRPIGFPKAINIGALAAEGDYLVLLNNDTEILLSNTDCWIDILMAPFLYDNKISVTGPVKFDNIDTNRFFILFFCTMIKRSIYEELGGLDEIYTPGQMEDVDFCIRAENAGYKIMQVPKEECLTAYNGLLKVNFPIKHKHSQTISELSSQDDVYKRNAEIIFKKFGKVQR